MQRDARQAVIFCADLRKFGGMPYTPPVHDRVKAGYGRVHDPCTRHGRHTAVYGQCTRPVCVRVHGRAQVHVYTTVTRQCTQRVRAAYTSVYMAVTRMCKSPVRPCTWTCTGRTRTCTRPCARPFSVTYSARTLACIGRVHGA